MSNPVQAFPELQQEFLSQEDKYNLDIAKLNEVISRLNAEKAVALNDASKLKYDNLVLQLALKYSMKDKDVITEQGEIIRSKEEGAV